MTNTEKPTESSSSKPVSKGKGGKVRKAVLWSAKNLSLLPKNIVDWSVEKTIHWPTVISKAEGQKDALLREVVFLDGVIRRDTDVMQDMREEQGKNDIHSLVKNIDLLRGLHSEHSNSDRIHKNNPVERGKYWNEGEGKTHEYRKLRNDIIAQLHYLDNQRYWDLSDDAGSFSAAINDILNNKIDAILATGDDAIVGHTEVNALLVSLQSLKNRMSDAIRRKRGAEDIHIIRKTPNTTDIYSEYLHSKNEISTILRDISGNKEGFWQKNFLKHDSGSPAAVAKSLLQALDDSLNNDNRPGEPSDTFYIAKDKLRAVVRDLKQLQKRMAEEIEIAKKKPPSVQEKMAVQIQAPKNEWRTQRNINALRRGMYCLVYGTIIGLVGYNVWGVTSSVRNSIASLGIPGVAASGNTSAAPPVSPPTPAGNPFNLHPDTLNELEKYMKSNPGTIITQ